MTLAPGEPRAGAAGSRRLDDIDRGSSTRHDARVASDSVVVGAIGMLCVIGAVAYALHRLSQSRLGHEKREPEDLWNVNGYDMAAEQAMHNRIRRRGASDSNVCAPPPAHHVPMYVHHKKRLSNASRFSPMQMVADSPPPPRPAGVHMPPRQHQPPPRQHQPPTPQPPQPPQHYNMYPVGPQYGMPAVNASPRPHGVSDGGEIAGAGAGLGVGAGAPPALPRPGHGGGATPQHRTVAFNASAATEPAYGYGAPPQLPHAGNPAPPPPAAAVQMQPPPIPAAQANDADAGLPRPSVPFPKFLHNDAPLVHRSEPLLGATAERVPRTDFEIPFKELTTAQLIGQGAFGKVFQGRWRGTPVAIKMLVCQELTPDVVKEFRDEVAVLSALRHPNVILFMGACTVSPHLSIVTELAPLGSLWGVLHGGGRKLNWRTVLKMIIDTARGMAFLHSAKPSILHRDLKSGNLLVDEAYTIKLSDFGLARVKAYTATMTGNCGTFQWMAPEVLANSRYTEMADVYSFGVVCWELFTSKCPYEGLNQIQVAIAVLNEGKRLEVPDSTPAEVASLVRSCWINEPDKRPSFLQILDILESLPA